MKILGIFNVSTQPVPIFFQQLLKSYTQFRPRKVFRSFLHFANERISAQRRRLKGAGQRHTGSWLHCCWNEEQRVPFEDNVHVLLYKVRDIPEHLP